MRWSRRSLVALIFSVLFLLSSTLMDFPAQTVAAIGNTLVIQDTLTPVDVIHVIAGEDYRTDYAIQLYQQGYARLLFFTGGWCTQHNYYHGAHALQLALQAGIPRQAVMYDDSSVSSTYDEALLLKKFLQESQPAYHTIMVVSDPYHMRRSQWTYRHVLEKEFTALMAPVPFERTPFQRQWWADRSSFNYVSGEYQKLIFYFFRYQLNLTWLGVLDNR